MNSKIKLTVEQKNYIAGFIDGDGSIFAQIIQDKSCKYGFRIRVSIGFYQDKKSYWFMLKMRKLLNGYGYTRIRKDGIAEYIITASGAVEEILTFLKSDLLLKKKVANLALEVIKKKRNINSVEEFIEVCKLVDQVAECNYLKNRKITSAYVINFLNL